jgi:hypothetical protein
VSIVDAVDAVDARDARDAVVARDAVDAADVRDVGGSAGAGSAVASNTDGNARAALNNVVIVMGNLSIGAVLARPEAHRAS